MWMVPRSRRASWSSCSALTRLCARQPENPPQLEWSLLSTPDSDLTRHALHCLARYEASQSDIQIACRHGSGIAAGSSAISCTNEGYWMRLMHSGWICSSGCHRWRRTTCRACALFTKQPSGRCCPAHAHCSSAPKGIRLHIDQHSPSLHIWLPAAVSRRHLPCPLAMECNKITAGSAGAIAGA